MFVLTVVMNPWNILLTSLLVRIIGQMTPYGVLLRFYREMHGYSQRAFAALIGCSNRTLSAIETGRLHAHDSQMIDRIAGALGLTGDETTSLRMAAENSATMVRIPSGTSPERVVLINQLVANIPQLSREEMVAIKQIIQRNSGAAR